MRKYQLLFLLLIILVSACKKDRDQPTEIAPQRMDDLVVPADFDWKTTYDYTFDLSSTNEGIVSIESQDGAVFYKALLSQSANLSVKINLPSYLKKVQVKQLGRIMEKELNQETITASFQ
jgi:hypothetical protein